MKTLNIFGRDVSAKAIARAAGALWGLVFITGALLMFGSIGWLTFAWSPLAKALEPYNFMPGMLGQGIVILWLFIIGVTTKNYNENEA